jgi:membrane protein YdbS with pleckstrin-like domain
MPDRIPTIDQHLHHDEAPHKPADDREVVYFEGNPLLRGNPGTLALWFTIAAAMLAAGAAGMYYWKIWWLALIGAGAACICIILPILYIRRVHYRISNYRIDYERGVFSKTIDTLELWHVDDIRLHQSLLDRILRVGTITIMSNDKTTPRLPLHGLPSPRPIFDNLKQRIIAVKRQRGVIKMDMGG